MNPIFDYFRQAELSLAAYANLSTGAVNKWGQTRLISQFSARGCQITLIYAPQ